MSSDTWKGGLGNWAVAANWTAGVPTSTSAVTVATGEAQATTAIDIASLFDTATVDFISAGASTISAGVINEGFLNIDAVSGSGGSSLTSSGALRNTGVVQLGASDNSLTKADTVKFATINNNFGELDLNGGATAAQEMTLDITTGAAGFGAAGVVLGDVSLTGHSVIEFASGQITTVGSGATLTLNGASAFLADASNHTANSALSGLSLNAGVFNLINGATVTTGALNNINAIALDSALASAKSLLTINGNYDNNGITDVGAQSVGGALMIVNGVLYNDDQIDIGTTAARRSSTLRVNSIVNYGVIDVAGMTPTAALSLLKVEAVAGFGQTGQLIGDVYLIGDSEVQFTSGAISQIDQGAYLELEGSNARIADASAQSTNSALTGLTTISGTFSLQSGAVVTISNALTIGSFGDLLVDSAYALSEYGGAAITVAGALNNQGEFDLGNEFLTTVSTASVSTLNNSGELNVQGSFSAPEKATLTVRTGVAGFGVAGELTGNVTVEGDATIAFASGEITTIEGSLTLWGPQATISDASSLTTNSALTGLTTNNYEFSMQGGSHVSLSGSLLNNGLLEVDTQNSGGSTLTIAGALTNADSLDIGSSGMTAAATVTAASESGGGTTELDGGAAASDLALLNIKSAATTLTSFVELSSYARLEYASGAITSIAADGGLREFGAHAVIAIASALTTNSALKTLSSNAGSIQLDDGATLAISNGVSNAGSISLDGSVEPPSTGGSSLSVTGTLLNLGSIYVGNPGSVANDKISATTLNNVGSITLSGAAATAQAVMSIASAAGFGAAGVLRGGVSLSGYSSIEFVSGAISQIANGASLNLSGADAFIEDGVTNTNSALSTLASVAGEFSLSNGAHLSTGALAVTGSVNVGGQSALAAGATVNYGDITVGGYDLLQVATIAATSLVNYGSLMIEGGAAAAEAAKVVVATAAGAAGNGVLGGTVDITGFGSLKYASGQIATIANGADVTLSGPDAFIENATLNANSALEGLSTIAGAFDVSDGVHITTTVGLTVSGSFSVDGGYGNLGGSLVKIGGTLTTDSDATVTLGNTSLTTATSLSASSLSNGGNLYVDGATGSGHATLTVASAAGFGTAGQLQGSAILTGAAAIEFASGQISTIAYGADLALSGASAVIEDGATGTNSALQGLATNNGEVSLNDGAKLTTTVALTNNYVLDVDAGYGAGGSNLKIGGLLTLNESMSIGNYELSDDSLVTASSLLNAAGINLTGYKTAQAELSVTGAFTNDGYVGIVNDTETIAGAVTGSGGNDFTINNSTLQFNSSVDANQTIEFTGADTLTLKRADLFAGFSENFGADDVIVATNFVAGTTSSFANDIMTLTNGSLSAHLHFDGSYVSTDFSVVAGASGTTIKFV